jgi:hypothetical protein
MFFFFIILIFGYFFTLIEEELRETEYIIYEKDLLKSASAHIRTEQELADIDDIEDLGISANFFPGCKIKFRKNTNEKIAPFDYLDFYIHNFFEFHERNRPKTLKNIFHFNYELRVDHFDLNQASLRYYANFLAKDDPYKKHIPTLGSEYHPNINSIISGYIF